MHADNLSVFKNTFQNVSVGRQRRRRTPTGYRVGRPDVPVVCQIWYYVIQAFDSGGRLGASLLKLVIEKVKPLLRKK